MKIIYLKLIGPDSKPRSFPDTSFVSYGVLQVS